MILLLCTLSLVVSFFTVSVSSECVSGTFASHPDSCDKYLVCGSEGEFYEMPCSPGTWFNPDINVCDWPTDVTSCVNGTRTTTSNVSLHQKFTQAEAITISRFPHYTYNFPLFTAPYFL